MSREGALFMGRKNGEVQKLLDSGSISFGFVLKYQAARRIRKTKRIKTKRRIKTKPAY